MFAQHLLRLLSCYISTLLWELSAYQWRNGNRGREHTDIHIYNNNINKNNSNDENKIVHRTNTYLQKIFSIYQNLTGLSHLRWLREVILIIIPWDTQFPTNCPFTETHACPSPRRVSILCSDVGYSSSYYSSQLC